ncbi:DUF429 domain-containing protein [Natribaculum luteum]|uniref:DUF429 domain-containing protein n=1 Tax=Natribaculum luteum TaxID=1586232 RepID=A0ABD5P0R4_9EURY|nr:DUF429 domain-containing protein [Natribaculum luteum]
MSKYIGVDWASNGWFAFCLTDRDDANMDFYPSIYNLWHHQRDADRLLIDIPIGLSSNGKRACDIEAKQALGSKRGNSVFYTPIREGVEAQNIKEAKQAQKALDFSVQNQAWAIVPRIQEVDEFFEMFAGKIGDTDIRETHPEICFWALNDGEPMTHGKKTEEGIEERLGLLSNHLTDARGLYEEAVETFTEPEWAPVIGKSGRDDILDAMVAALTARECGENPPRLPKESSPEYDDVRGREMEIIFWPNID